MSAKDIDPLFSNLNTALIDLQCKKDDIISRYEDLERQLGRQKKSSFTCRKCAKKFGNLKELQKHKK